MKTPDYVQVVGFIDQTKINLQADDSGGELGRREHIISRVLGLISSKDPHGAGAYKTRLRWMDMHLLFS
jgi:hypothetical protein